MKLPIELLDEIFRFTDKPNMVLYFKKLMSRQTIKVLYKSLSIDTEAKKGNLQTIRYFRERVGIKYTFDVYLTACLNGHVDVAKYLNFDKKFYPDQ